MKVEFLLLTSPMLHKALSRKHRSSLGFSLIELVVVIAVLAVLIAIALPNFLGVQRDAKVSTAKNTLSNLIKECAIKESRGVDALMGTSGQPDAVATAFTDLNGYTIRDSVLALRGRTDFSAAAGNGYTSPSAGSTPARDSSCYAAIAEADDGSGLANYAIFYNQRTGQVLKRCNVPSGNYAEGCFTDRTLRNVVTNGPGFW